MATHSVYMYFFARDGWVVQFLEADLKTSIGPIRTYRAGDPEATVREIAQRGRAFTDLACRQAFDAAIEKGRGGIHLTLTAEQYVRLKQPQPQP